MDEAREQRRAAGLELARANIAKPRVLIDRRAVSDPPPVDQLTKWRNWKPEPAPEPHRPTDAMIARMIGELRAEMHATVAAHREFVRDLLVELVVGINGDIDEEIQKLRRESPSRRVSMSLYPVARLRA